MDYVFEALSQGVIPGIIIAIYLVIIKIIDYKNTNRQSEVSEKLTNSIANISNFLDNITKTIINKEQEHCRIVIELAFDSFKKELFIFVRETIIANNIDVKKDFIVQSIDKLVNSYYYKLYNQLSSFEINNHKLSIYCKEEWKEELINYINDIIFNHKLDKVDKITEAQNKLDIVIGDYSTYVHNKIFN